MKLLRIVLLPFSALYWLVLRIRHFLYDSGILKVYEPVVPVICVGNLSTGGTGKTPFTIYLARILSDVKGLAILSRGYKRKSRGFVLAEWTSSAADLGDEPLLMYQQLNNIILGVEADRQNGIRRLINDHQAKIILLDDAFQHRRVKAGLNILLTDFRHLYTDEWLLPAGNLRDIRQRAKAAQIIVVTKCPQEVEQQKILQKINPHPDQSVFFTRYQYRNLYAVNGKQTFPTAFLGRKGILLVTGIAHPEYLEAFLREKATILKTVNFSDHHDYRAGDIQRITEIFDNFDASPKLVVTTEKDAVKLMQPAFSSLLLKLPLIVLTIDIEFIENQENFEREVKKYVKEN